MKTILRFFNEAGCQEFVAVDCTPTDTQDAADVRQDHIDRLWNENNGAREAIFDGVEW